MSELIVKIIEERYFENCSVKLFYEEFKEKHLYSICIFKKIGTENDLPVFEEKSLVNQSYHHEFLAREQFNFICSILDELDFLKKCNNEGLKNIIKNFRLNMRLNRHEMADLLGVASSSVRNWEQGVCKPNPSALKILLQYPSFRKYFH